MSDYNGGDDHPMAGRFFNPDFKNTEPDPVSKRFGAVGDGPRTEPMRRHTMAYSMVDADEARKRHGGTASAKLAALAPTEMMQALIPTAPVVIGEKTTSVKTIVSQLIERDVAAWTALPQDTRDLMLANPDSFTLVPSGSHPNDIPNVRYKGVELKWNGAESWLLVSIGRV